MKRKQITGMLLCTGCLLLLSGRGAFGQEMGSETDGAAIEEVTPLSEPVQEAEEIEDSGEWTDDVMESGPDEEAGELPAETEEESAAGEGALEDPAADGSAPGPESAASFGDDLFTAQDDAAGEKQETKEEDLPNDPGLFALPSCDFTVTGVAGEWMSSSADETQMAKVTYRVDRPLDIYVYMNTGGESVAEPAWGEVYVESRRIRENVRAYEDLSMIAAASTGDLFGNGGYFHIFVYGYDADTARYASTHFVLSGEEIPVSDEELKEEASEEEAQREKQTFSVEDNRITGLGGVLSFPADQYNRFYVTEAGSSNYSPIEGDERYEYVGWSVSADPSEEGIHVPKEIGSRYGIYESGSYEIHVWFRKYVFETGKWRTDGVLEDKTVSFQTAAVSPAPVELSNDRGTHLTSCGANYTVKNKKSVIYEGPVDAQITEAVIPDTIKVDGITYRVSGIGKSAFRNNQKLKSVTIGRYVRVIGRYAFQSCLNLSKIVLRSERISRIGENAFRNTGEEITVWAPETRMAAYSELLKKAGISKEAVFKSEEKAAS